MAGRPTKLTPALQARICEAIRGGNYRETAAAWAGIPPETLSRWMHRRGERYLAFAQAVREAEQAAEVRAVALIMKAASEDPNHAKWWLERKFPDRWGRRERHEVSGPAGRPLEVRDVSAAGLSSRIAALVSQLVAPVDAPVRPEADASPGSSPSPDARTR